MTARELQQIIEGKRVSDGAGVVLYRSLGQHPQLRMDPFLMLDEFGSENPDEYIAGFPDHPHRGFETVTYMLEGHMQHGDHLGHTGNLREGDVQWMTAGRGIIHSEMPQQQHGRMRGFQLWLNLPADAKMQEPAYRDIPASTIPEAKLADGVTVKVIAGELRDGDQLWRGPAQAPVTEPQYWDIHLSGDASFSYPLGADYQVLIYVYEGSVTVGDKQTPLGARQAGILSPGEQVSLSTTGEPAKCLLIAGKPLHEPVAQWGPFVMNTHQQIEQAILDYQEGRLV